MSECITNGQLISSVYPSGYAKITDEAPEYIQNLLIKEEDPRIFALQSKDLKGETGLILYFRTDVLYDIENVLKSTFGSRNSKDRYKVEKYPTDSISGKKYRYKQVCILDQKNKKFVIKNLSNVISSLLSSIEREKKKVHKLTTWSF